MFEFVEKLVSMDEEDTERNPERIDEFLETLKSLWKKCPELTYGQLNQMIELGLPKESNILQIEEVDWEKAIIKITNVMI